METPAEVVRRFLQMGGCQITLKVRRKPTQKKKREEAKVLPFPKEKGETKQK